MATSRAVPACQVTAWRAATALGLVVVVSWACSPGQPAIAAPCAAVAAGQQPDLDSALAVHRRHTMQLMAIPGVVGTGVGLTADCRPAITIFTKQAGVTGLPDSLEGIPVQVQVTGEIFAQPA